MSDWNPNSTGTKGLEWLASVAGNVTLDSNLKSAVMSLRQTTAQVIDTVKVGVGAIPTRGGLYALEVYDNETAVAANVTTLAAQPNQDVSGTGAAAWQEDDGTTTTIYSEIDEVTLDLADYIKLPAPTFPGITYAGRLNTGGLALAGKRILAVRLNAVVRLNRSASLDIGLSISGVDYFSDTTFHNLEAGSVASATWYYNPGTKAPWTIADVQAFDTSDEYLLYGLIMDSGSDLKVYQVWMDVVICDENRLAVGTLNDTASALTPNALNAVTVLTPTAGAWTKDGAGYHLFMLRRLNSTGALVVPTVDSGTAAYPGNGYAPTLDATYGYATAMGDPLTRLFQVLPHVNAGSESVDGQPYRAVIGGPVYTGVVVEQEFSDAAATTYGPIRCLVQPASAGTTASLTVEIWDRAAVKVGTGTFTITPAMWAAAAPISGSTYRLVEGSLSAVATLAAGHQYYFKFTCTAASNVGWVVCALDIGGAVLGEIAGFGGTTDRGTVLGGAENGRYEVPATIQTVPTAPANFTVTTGELDIDATVCGVDTIERAELSWTATALGADFLRYEIQRSEDAGVTWEAPAVVTVESVNAWYDYEGRRGIPVCYQMRTVRADGAVSDWTATLCATKTGGGRDVYFVSNYDATYNVAYTHEPQVDYAFLETDEAVLVAIYGVDKNRGYRPTEYRGTAVAYTLAVGFDTVAPSGGGTGFTAFDPLRDIARAQLPYVCVLDWHGNRLYAQLAVTRGVEAQPADRYQAEAVCSEVGGPYMLTVTTVPPAGAGTFRITTLGDFRTLTAGDSRVVA